MNFLNSGFLTQDLKKDVYINAYGTVSSTKSIKYKQDLSKIFLSNLRNIEIYFRIKIYHCNLMKPYLFRNVNQGYFVLLKM